MTMLSGAREAESGSFSERDWSRILQRIADGKVIPVIGEHLTTMTSGEPPRELTLANHLAERLGLQGPPTASLNEVAFRYLRNNPRGLDDLYADIFDEMRMTDAFPLPTPLRQLAEIRCFNLFVTTSFDPYMALALNEVRFGRRTSGSTRVFGYERNRAVDIPENLTGLDYPIVYHLFGKAQASPLFAVTDEDVLEFVHTLQAPECQPPNLTDALREQRLLVLGTRMTGWLTRFFLRVTSADRLRDARRSDYLVDAAVNTDADQVLFFENFGEVKLLPMSAAEFIDELSRRWKARYPAQVAPDRARRGTPAPLGAGDVFLSYASEDVAIVKQLRERLEREAGVRVWLDRESLRGGDHWERCIADTLRSCAICVPVVSARAKSGNFRFVRTEWKEALRLQAGQPADRRFILPLAIDDTRADDVAIDPELRAINWRRMLDEDDMRRFIAEVRAGVEASLSP